MSTSALRDDLVTGEALAVEVPAAGPGLRALSGGIDVVATVLLGIGLGVAATHVFDGADEAFLAGVAVVASVTLLVLVPTALEYATGGRTLGKLVTGLRTVRDDGGPADLRRYLARHLVGTVEIWGLGGAPALVAGLVTRRTKRLGDLVAGTIVVRDRRALPPPTGAVVPPDLAAWARSAQLSAIPADTLARARHLRRYGARFDAGARERLTAQVAHELSEHVAPPPPAGAPPALVVEAVLGRRRELDAARLEREDRLRARFEA